MKKSNSSSQAYHECLDRIYRLGRFGIKLELDTIAGILNLLNNPQKNYRIVHVAGTNGKGSVATYIASVLRQAGFRTGLYTSPHLVSFNERISINGHPVSDDEVVQAYNAVNAVDLGKRKATFFEIATAMGFYLFSRKNVDWAVIETGMGGRFDATNIVNPQVSIITNLSIEHTDYLGSTIKALAVEKSGIIKPGAPVVTGVSQASGLEVIKSAARKNGCDLYIHKKDFSARKDRGRSTVTFKGIFNTFEAIENPLRGNHQKHNLCLALAACELIFDSLHRKNPEYRLEEALVKKAVAAAKWPGRLEQVMESPLVILDGAHNLDAAKALSEYLGCELKDRTLTLVMGILNDKPHEKMLKLLAPCADRIILTKAAIDRSIDPAILEQDVKKFVSCPVTIIENVKSAVDYALEISKKEDAVCVAGSLYVVGEAKEKFDLPLDQNPKIK